MKGAAGVGERHMVTLLTKLTLESSKAVPETSEFSTVDVEFEIVAVEFSNGLVELLIRFLQLSTFALEAVETLFLLSSCFENPFSFREFGISITLLTRVSQETWFPLDEIWIESDFEICITFSSDRVLPLVVFDFSQFVLEAVVDLFD